jgi:hypothetical protein
MTKVFKTVCAWCGDLLRGDLRCEVISHGICDQCYVLLVLPEIELELMTPLREPWEYLVDLGGEG